MIAPPALEVLVVGHPNHDATTIVDLRGRTTGAK